MITGGQLVLQSQFLYSLCTFYEFLISLRISLRIRNRNVYALIERHHTEKDALGDTSREDSEPNLRCEVSGKRSLAPRSQTTFRLQTDKAVALVLSHRQGRCLIESEDGTSDGKAPASTQKLTFRGQPLCLPLTWKQKTPSYQGDSSLAPERSSEREKESLFTYEMKK